MTFEVIMMPVTFLFLGYSRPLGLTDSSPWLLIFEVILVLVVGI